jgi:SAM-dependent methyltransferase
MRLLIKDFVKIVSESLPIIEPIYEFGSLQVPGQEGFADLRPFFPGKEYVGCDMVEGLGVDSILDIHDIDLPSKSVGTVIIMDTLEHVEYFREAMNEVHRILKPKGIVIVSSVMNFHIHNYPHDYWRFTPKGLSSILGIFPTSFVDFAGEERFPHTVIGIGFKTLVTDSMDEFRRRIYLWRVQYTESSRRRNWRDFVKLFIPPVILNLYRKIIGWC